MAIIMRMNRETTVARHTISIRLTTQKSDDIEEEIEQAVYTAAGALKLGGVLDYRVVSKLRSANPVVRGVLRMDLLDETYVIQVATPLVKPGWPWEE